LVPINPIEVLKQLHLRGEAGLRMLDNSKAPYFICFHPASSYFRIASRHTFSGFGKAALRELFFHFRFSKMEKGIMGNYFDFLEAGCGENQDCVLISVAS
jgi:hypothetical protein